MSSPAHTLGELLQRGDVKRGRLVRQREGFPRWELGRLFGRVIEITGVGATARLTVATQLVLRAQQVGEPVAWVTGRNATFYPPDVAEHGVDLAALAVVRTESVVAVLRAADQLLRSGAFGLVAVDFRERIRAPLQAEMRLANLAKTHDAILLWLRDEPRGSLTSLRATSRRARSGDGNGKFECSLHVIKDKRTGQEWQHVEVFHGSLGLR